MEKPTPSDADASPARAARGHASSDTLAHFRMVDEIARGGMGVVLRAHDVEMGRDVAIKMLREGLGQNAEVLRRFVEEAQITGQLQHPGIVPVYEIGETAEGQPFFAMKLVKGRTLAEELGARRSPSADLPRMLSVFESVTQTMAYAHSRHVIHRDLKPSNVMVGAYGEVLLVDWGLAKVLTREPRVRSGDSSFIETVRSDSSIEWDQSTSGSVLGTLEYMSPEQARGEVEHLDERTDVFALGAILCEILTGQPPYPRDRERCIPMVRAGDLSHAEEQLERCSADAELVALARACLEPTRTARPADAGLVAERIGAWLASTEERAQAARVEAAEARAREAGERRARWLTVGLAASVLFAVFLVGGVQLRRQQELSERRRQTEEDVAEHLTAASFARGSGLWNQARVAVAQARARLESGSGDAELAARIAAEEHALERDWRAVQAERELAARRERFERAVETIRTRVSRTDRAKLAAYSEVMEEFGVDVSAPFDEVVQTIRASRLDLEMAGLLVDWARLQRLVDPAATDEVARLLRLALAVDADPWRSRLRRAILAGDRAEVLRIAREEADEVRLDPMTVIVLADELWLYDERAEAMRLLEQAELQHPDDFHLHTKLAARHMNLLDTDGAFVHLKAALARTPENPWLLATLGLMYLQRGDVPRAVAVCEKAVSADPEDAYARHYLGVTLAAQGDPDAAIAAYREAIALDPEYALAIRRLAWALADTGEDAESLALFVRAAELEPDNASALNSAAWRLATVADPALRDPARALAFAEQAMSARPDDPRTTAVYAACLVGAERYADAIAACEWAQSLAEDDAHEPLELFVLALAHARLGHADEARAWLERGERWLSAADAASAEMLLARERARAALDAR